MFVLLNIVRMVDNHCLNFVVVNFVDVGEIVDPLFNLGGCWFC